MGRKDGYSQHRFLWTTLFMNFGIYELFFMALWVFVYVKYVGFYELRLEPKMLVSWGFIKTDVNCISYFINYLLEYWFLDFINLILSKLFFINLVSFDALSYLHILLTSPFTEQLSFLFRRFSLRSADIKQQYLPTQKKTRPCTS